MLTLIIEVLPPNDFAMIAFANLNIDGQDVFCAVFTRLLTQQTSRDGGDPALVNLSSGKKEYP